MNNKRLHPANNDKGSIYITVVIIIAVVLMLLSSLTIIVGRDSRTSDLYGAGIKAYYLAHSGITEGISYIIENDPQGNPANPSDLSTNPFASSYSPDHSYSWSVTYNAADKNYKIDATGIYQYNENISVTREIEAVVELNTDKSVKIISWSEI